MGLKKGQKTKKVTDSHTTLTRTSADIVEVATKLSEVSKIGIGIIKHIGNGGEKRIKFTPINGGVKAAIKGNGAIQELFIYTNDSEHVAKKLKEVVNKNN